MFILAIIVVIVAAVIMAIGFAFWKDKDPQAKDDDKAMGKLGFFVGIFIGIIGLGLIFWSLFIIIIPENSIGVQIVLGKAQDSTLNTGFNIKNPLAKVESFSFQTEIFDAPDLSAASKDLQTVNASITVNWRIDSASAINIFKEFRFDSSNRILKPAIEESLKAATASFNAEELVSKRAQVRDTFTQVLRDKLNTFETCPGCIRIVETNLGNFGFSEVFDDAVEAKVKAEQQALEAKNITTRITEEAKQTEARAIGERRAAIERAEGVKQSTILEAEGEALAIESVANAQAKANNVISASLSDEIIRWQLVNGIEVQTAILPSGSEFILGPEIFGGLRTP